MAHQKHPPLKRPASESYARTEFALVGTTCARMEALMAQWQAALPAGSVLTVTGDHGTPRELPFAQYGSKQFSGGLPGWNSYDERMLGRHFALALVNGNHYPAQRQIVFIDPAKAGTLARRQAQLTSVAAVVFCPGAEALPDFLAQGGGGAQVQCSLAEAGEVLLPLLRAALPPPPPVKAVILTGGKSSRMGTDKSQLRYRPEVSETERMIRLCQAAGLETFCSVAHDAPLPDTPAEGVLPDRFVGLGPLGAICTAMLNDPDAAWLVLPCDLPLFEAVTLQRLLAARQQAAVATAIQLPDRPFPEPLAAIYEPRAYPRLLQFLSLGYACPRKMLINSPVELVQLDDPLPLTNANTPAERAQVVETLRARRSTDR